MNKELLKQAVMQLLEAEAVCRRLYAYHKSNEKGNADFDKAYKDVILLANRVREIQQQIPELAEKRYWWDIPFSLEECDVPDGFSFEDGEYIESDSVYMEEEDGKKYLLKKSSVIDYSRMARDLTQGIYIPLFVNKKQLRLHINEPMVRRELYNAVWFQKWEMNVPDLTHNKENAVEIWNDYQKEAVFRQAEFEEYLKAYNEKMNEVEKIAHASLFTNEERWFAGRMSTEDYLKENVLREWAPLEKNRKMLNELQKMRMQATLKTQKIRERQMEMRRNAIHERKTIRIFPVGHVIYYENQIMAIFLNQTETTVWEYECDPKTELTELTGRCYDARILYNKKGLLIPLVQYLAAAYKNKLPDFNVFSLKPSGCPEFVWRSWIEARWREK